MALYSADQLQPWVTPQLRPFDPSVLSDLARLGLTAGKMRQEEMDKYKPDMSAYGVDKLKGMAGDVSIVARQANQVINGYNQLIKNYGGDVLKANQSSEYQTVIEPALSKLLYNKQILDENYLKYQQTKTLAPEELQQVYLDNEGKPKIIEGAKGQKHFLTKEEYLNLEFKRTDPTKLNLGDKTNAEGLLQPIDFNMQKGSIKNFNDEMKSIYGSTGSSDLSGVQWDKLANMDKSVGESLNALMNFAPYSNSNAQQISSAVDAFLSGGVSEESAHGLRQAYWKKIESQGMKMKDENDTFAKFVQDQIKQTSKIYIKEQLGVPKSGDGSGSGSKEKHGFWGDSIYGINYSPAYVDRIAYKGKDDSGRDITYEAPIGTFKYIAPQKFAKEAYPTGSPIISYTNGFYFNGKRNNSADLSVGGYVLDYVETNYKPYKFNPLTKDYELPETEEEALSAIEGKDINAAGQQVQGAPRVMPFDKVVMLVHEEDMDEVVKGYSGFDYTTAPVKGQNKRVLSEKSFRSDNFAWMGGIDKEAQDAKIVLNTYTKKEAEAKLNTKLPSGGGIGDKWFEVVVEIPRNPNLVYLDSEEAKNSFVNNRLEYLTAIRDKMQEAMIPLGASQRSFATIGTK